MTSLAMPVGTLHNDVFRWTFCVMPLWSQLIASPRRRRSIHQRRIPAWYGATVAAWNTQPELQLGVIALYKDFIEAVCCNLKM
jgi:hypothetical protein